jgi:hypothetical protein
MRSVQYVKFFKQNVNIKPVKRPAHSERRVCQYWCSVDSKSYRCLPTFFLCFYIVLTVYCLLGCKVMQSSRSAVTSPKKALPLSKCNSSKKPARSERLLELAQGSRFCCLLAPQFDPEHGGSIFLRNNGELLDYTAQHSRSQYCS